MTGNTGNNDNLELYNKVKEVPKEAQKKITGGRLSNMTNINPMWRIKELTKQFGICGFGWKYEITKQWIEQGANGEISAFVNINLYVKCGDTWSDAIPGTGGSAYVAKERNGLYTSDECYKMALTDAMSVACKSLGFGADIYWDEKTKYDDIPKANPPHGNTGEDYSEFIPPTKQQLARAKKLGIALENVANAYQLDSIDEIDTDILANAIKRKEEKIKKDQKHDSGN